MAFPLINLCDPIFKASITCSTVSSEGYEVSNLLSEDSKKRRDGFLGDRFIKPPIEITLKFPFDVNMRYIQIGAEVGQQKSTGLEFYSSSVPYNSSLCSGCPVSKSQSNSNLVCSPISERIASIVLNDGERGVVVFCPLQYGRQSPNPVPNVRADFAQRSMMWKKRGVIAHVSSLTLRIFRTHGSSIPAVGSIEVWGGPSSCMTTTKISDVMRLWKAAQEKQSSNVMIDVHQEEKPIVLARQKADISVLSDIPEEFLDAITWEVMALPMVLPSGKVVDQQTLDLHAQAEANWGRHPSDPFTGLMFSDGCRPVLDSALKSRIDRFLVLNQDRRDLKTVPRTVGRAQPQICHQSVSRFRNNRVCFDSMASNRKRPPPSLSNATRFPHHGSGLHESLPSCSSYQSSRETGNFKVQKVGAKKPKLDESLLKDSKGNGIVPDNILNLNEHTDHKNWEVNVNSHEKRLDDSLDFALKSVLSGLPSFVNPPAQEAAAKECGSCKVSESLYQLPCTHFLCRPCLVKENKQKPSACQTCKSEFKSCDPTFYHE